MLTWRWLTILKIGKFGTIVVCCNSKGHLSVYMQKVSAYFISMGKFTEVKWLPMAGDTNFIVSSRL